MGVDFNRLDQKGLLVYKDNYIVLGSIPDIKTEQNRFKRLANYAEKLANQIVILRYLSKSNDDDRRCRII